MYKPFKLKKACDGQFYIVTISENGRILDKTENYRRKRACYAKVRAIFRLTKSLVPTENIRNYIEDTTLKPKKNGRVDENVVSTDNHMVSVFDNVPDTIPGDASSETASAGKTCDEIEMS